MKLGEKILDLRKKKGLSQEELGEKINVTRQTISNWELGETMPNPDQLKQLSKEFNVSIDELLDNDIKNVVIEKISNTEKLAGVILRIIKISLCVLVLAFLFLILHKIIVSNKDTGRKMEESIYCKIYGEEHGFDIVYEEYTGRPLELGGDSYFSDVLNLGQYNDANQIFNVINDYAKKNNGSCIRISDHNLNDIVDVSIKEDTLTNTNVTLAIKENYDYDISYGEEFWIEKYNYNTNTYQKLPINSNNNCDFNMISYDVKDKPLFLKQDWSCMYGELDKGMYLLVKEVSFKSDIPIKNHNDIYYIWTEFKIE